MLMMLTCLADVIWTKSTVTDRPVDKNWNLVDEKFCHDQSSNVYTTGHERNIQLKAKPLVAQEVKLDRTDQENTD